jgi:tRNA (cmo5U34)-methyltransferase
MHLDGSLILTTPYWIEDESCDEDRGASGIQRRNGYKPDNHGMAIDEWTTREHALRYLRRADEYPRRAEGESVLLEHVPHNVRRVLDLGTGDGRLLALLQIDRPGMRAVGVDSSDVMLEAARARFTSDERVELVRHDLAEPLPALGRFDAIVSSFAIHHLEHERKRSLLGEVYDLLEPGGLFANFEHVASPTGRLHRAFFAAIDEPLEHEDPSDRLLDVQAQLQCLRALGFEDVDCYWKWLEMALLVGVRRHETSAFDDSDE